MTRTISRRAAADPSPLRAAFYEWRRLHALTSEPIDDESEVARRCAAQRDLERELHAMPATSASDLAIKIAVLAASDFGDGHGRDALTLDVRRVFAADGIDWEPTT